MDNPIRKLLHDPEKILRDYIETGQTVVDIGCGPGIFSIAMANLVGETGKVIAVDIQDKMLERLRKKIARHDITNITLHKSEPDRIGVTEKVDFVLAFYMVHEVPDKRKFFDEVAGILKPQRTFLVVEPKLHVSASSFSNTVNIARSCGLLPVSEPKIRFSRAIVFEKG